MIIEITFPTVCLWGARADSKQSTFGRIYLHYFVGRMKNSAKIVVALDTVQIKIMCLIEHLYSPQVVAEAFTYRYLRNRQKLIQNSGVARVWRSGGKVWEGAVNFFHVENGAFCCILAVLFISLQKLQILRRTLLRYVTYVRVMAWAVRQLSVCGV